MKDDTRKRISQLIVEELAEKIKRDDILQHKLEPFADMPVEKVADAILKQFISLLSSDLRDLILHLIEQEIAAEKSLAALVIPEIESAPIPATENVELPQLDVIQDEKTMEVPTEKATESIMEHFAAKEHFTSEPIDFDFQTDDWFYLYCFSYAPDSTGKGVPSRKLSLKGIDKRNNIFLLDYGDIRFFMNKMNKEEYSLEKTGKPTLTSVKTTSFKYEHEKILNTIRAEEVIVSLPFWTIYQGRENIIQQLEDRYVELLRALIDVHDAIDWDVEVFAFDQHIIGLPMFSAVTR